MPSTRQLYAHELHESTPDAHVQSQATRRNMTDVIEIVDIFLSVIFIATSIMSRCTSDSKTSTRKSYTSLTKTIFSGMQWLPYSALCHHHCKNKHTSQWILFFTMRTVLTSTFYLLTPPEIHTPLLQKSYLWHLILPYVIIIAKYKHTTQWFVLFTMRTVLTSAFLLVAATIKRSRL